MKNRMKKEKRKTFVPKSFVAFFVVLVFSIATSAFAGDVTYRYDTTITIGSYDYVILSGSNATSVVVGSSSITVTTGANDEFTIISNDRHNLNDDSTSISASCETSRNTLEIKTAGTFVITPDPNTQCTVSTRGGGGGGGRNFFNDDDEEITPNTTTPTTPIPGGTITVSSLRPGTNGISTRAWQQALVNAGYNPGPIDGLWGPKTVAAIKAFQLAKGLTVDGWPGANTAAAMNAVSGTTPATPQTSTQDPVSTGTGSVAPLRPGTHGSATTAWQQALVNAGFDPGPIDGLWGPKTKAAIEAFQAAQGLTVDGWPGVNTAAAMNAL